LVPMLCVSLHEVRLSRIVCELAKLLATRSADFDGTIAPDDPTDRLFERYFWLVIGFGVYMSLRGSRVLRRVFGSTWVDEIRGSRTMRAVHGAEPYPPRTGQAFHGRAVKRIDPGRRL